MAEHETQPSFTSVTQESFWITKHFRCRKKQGQFCPSLRLSASSFFSLYNRLVVLLNCVCVTLPLLTEVLHHFKPSYCLVFGRRWHPLFALFHIMSRHTVLAGHLIFHIVLSDLEMLNPSLHYVRIDWNERKSKAWCKIKLIETRCTAPC